MILRVVVLPHAATSICACRMCGEETSAGVAGVGAGVMTTSGIVTVPGPDEAPPSAAPQVFGPTMPSATRPCELCHATVALLVCGPKAPSTFTPMMVCHCRTYVPVEPCRIVGGIAPELGGAATIVVVGSVTVPWSLEPPS